LRAQATFTALAMLVLVGGAAPPSASAGSAGAGSSPAVALVTIHPAGSAADRGIGPVRLEESQTQVTRVLGEGRRISSEVVVGERVTVYDYRSGSITLVVEYGNGEVAAVTTTSPRAILYGHRLAEGLPAFRKILRGRRGWKIEGCHDRVFTALAPGGPGTGIEWQRGHLELVMIDLGDALDGCRLL
jgi:hypothetical protein